MKNSAVKNEKSLVSHVSPMDISYLNEIVIIDFKGSITESSQFENIDLNNKIELHLNFEAVSYINSTGIRRWLFWMWNIEKEFPNMKILIERCPVVMWRQIMTIANFVPKVTQIKSFYVPYFCESCQAGSMKMFDSKPLLNCEDGVLKKKLLEESCKTCHGPLVMDASLEAINRFINNYKPD